MKPSYLELGSGERIPILYEDRSVIAIDKPAGWMLVPTTWQRTQRNLQTAIVSSIAGAIFGPVRVASSFCVMSTGSMPRPRAFCFSAKHPERFAPTVSYSSRAKWKRSTSR